MSKKINIYVFSQNLKLKSIKNFNYLGKNTINVFLTPHYLFQNEREFLEKCFDNCIYRCFADYLTDEEMEFCDEEAYIKSNKNCVTYPIYIKKIKNELILSNLNKEFSQYNGYILSDDIGIDKEVWDISGFKTLKGEYYYPFKRNITQKIKDFTKKNFKLKQNKTKQKLYDDIYVANYKDKKIIFVGKLHRIDYRLNINFVKSEYEIAKYNNHEYYTKEKCQYWTTWHEHFSCTVPNDEQYDVCWIQDGYLPSNFTSYDYDFKPKNVKYYAWDFLGTKLFKKRNLPVSIIPNRKKLYIPDPKFPKEIKNILVVASGSGDWTALKNRSDDDLLVYAFSEIAKKYPNINIVYRCHPTWTLPVHLGVNSINRVAKYFRDLRLKNIKLSMNIPKNDINNFNLTFRRSSLDEDLKNADFVFGEHSISMIDAALKGIPFASVNMSNRRDLYSDITEMGFPHCENITEIVNVITKHSDLTFKNNYLKAIEKYNEMTDMELL